MAKQRSKKHLIKVANIIERSGIAGPQIRIAEVSKKIKSLQGTLGNNISSKNIENMHYCTKKRQDFFEVNSVSHIYHMNNKKYETTVIFPKNKDEEFADKLKAYNIPYIRVPLRNLSKNICDLITYTLFFPFDIIWLLLVLKKNKFDIVHVSGGAWQIKGIIAGRLAGCKVLWHLNDTKMPRIIRMLFRFIAIWGPDAFIVAGQRVRSYYFQELGFENLKSIFEIQAPVDCSYFDPQIVNTDPKIVDIKAIKIVSVGNINPDKGFEYYMKMAKLLNTKYTDLHFFIVGPYLQSQQGYTKLLEKIKAENDLLNVTFYGASTDVRQVHKAADIYVCTSIAEASPLAVWEAMAMQKPVVATDVGDISRFVKHGENGYITDPMDVEALAFYVGKLVQDKDLRKEFGFKARQVALKYLDISVVANKHLKAYRWAASR